MPKLGVYESSLGMNGIYNLFPALSLLWKKDAWYTGHAISLVLLAVQD
jgi:hypothetical protein